MFSGFLFIFNMFSINRKLIKERIKWFYQNFKYFLNFIGNYFEGEMKNFY